MVDTQDTIRLVAHCDWSMHPNKRWVAAAIKRGEDFHCAPPVKVGDIAKLLSTLKAKTPDKGCTLVGFDFPIGLPVAYAERLPYSNFPEALSNFGQGEWEHWFDVAEQPDEINLKRPFYPKRPGGTQQSHLTAALDVENIDDLKRLCEKRNATRSAACSIFWTLGGNQVGKGAIAGWKEVVQPSLSESQISLWPFDGTLSELAKPGQTILAETYPADAQHQIGALFSRQQSKTRASDRATLSESLLSWALKRNVDLDPELSRQIRQGFSESSIGEDQFDAVVGLFGMLEVVLGHRSEHPERSLPNRHWEGWILGQT